MALKTFRPITPTLRHVTAVDYSASLTPRSEHPGVPKSLFKPKKRTGARNSNGHITVRHQGGGHKKHYRVVDFDRNNHGVPGTIKAIDYDPNRTAFIALVFFKDGDKRYILAPIGAKVGDSVLASSEADILPGNHIPLHSIPVGTFIHNLEIEPGKGGALVRSAGSYAQLMAKEGTYCQVKMPSGEMRLIHRNCWATVGQVSNTDHENVKYGKAGRIRWMGVRPSVRGVAMNPVDHPMGGGEGKASGGHPRSPWGQAAKGYRTRKNKRTSQFIVKRRRA